MSLRNRDRGHAATRSFGRRLDLSPEHRQPSIWQRHPATTRTAPQALIAVCWLVIGVGTPADIGGSSAEV